MRLAYFQLALSMSIVGANVAVGKIIVNELPVFLFSELRFFIALLFLIPIVLGDSKKITPLSKNNLFFLFLQAFFGVFLFSIFILYGVGFTTATSAGIITSTVPATIALLSFFILGEKPSVRQVFSVGLAVLGISVISFQGVSTEKEGALLGNLLYYSVTASVLSFILWYRGVKKVAASIAGLYTGFMPIAATLVSLIFLKENFGLSQLSGMVCVLCAIYLGTKKFSRAEKTISQTIK